MKLESEFRVIITLGPASLNDTFLRFCASRSSCHFRLNAAHLEADQLDDYINQVFSRIRNQKIHFYLDLPGSKMRIGKFPENMALTAGELQELIPAEYSEGMAIPVPSTNYFHFISNGDELWLQDGTIRLKVLEVTDSGIKVKVNMGGMLRPQAGMIIKNRIYPFQKQMKDLGPYLEIAGRYQIGSVALSYVSGARDIQDLRSHVTQPRYQPKIIAKIENLSALKELETIIEAADSIWYCRGDMGTFISSMELAVWQDKIIKRSVKRKKPVFIAGQVFQYLVNHPQPSRTEVVHLYHLIKQHASGIVLSDETAIGKNPVESLRQIISLLASKSVEAV